ncbi:hypothetical protein [Wukongibacter sp. M2B1]|uniref:hypothetical protein n=1 Tax=Wukongibacter sp. M2B1 TaxID=3088895 RepID=UPI003D7B8EEA
MAGKTIGTMITMFIFVVFLLFMITYSMHNKNELQVDEINFNIVESVSTNGVFSTQIYNDLIYAVSRYGDYTIKIKLKEQISPGLYDIHYDTNYILDKKLKVGDKISVYLEDRNLSLFGRLMNASTFGIIGTDNLIDSRVKSIKTNTISKNGK